jgi:MerC mercury resistance protein
LKNREIPASRAWTLRRGLEIPNLQRIADLFAVSCSGLCAIHCLATPGLLIFLPVLGASIFGGESFHAAILWFILPTSLVALTLGCWQHKDRYVLVLCLIGLSGLFTAAVFGAELLGESGEMILTVVSSLLLIAGHFRNFSLCRCTACKG